MPLKAPRAPKYRHHKGSGQAFFQVKGQRYYLGKHGSEGSQERYRRFVAELLAATQQPHPPHPSEGLTVIEVIAAYWEHCQQYYRKNGEPTGWQQHIRLVLRLVRECYGHSQATDFGPLALKAVRQRFVDQGHSRSYVNKLVAIIPRMFKWAASEELVPGKIHQDLKSVEGLRKGRCAAPEPPPVTPVSSGIVDATLLQLPPVVADMVRFQQLTGARPGEVCIIRPCDVDRSGNVWEYRPGSHKTEHHSRGRVILIGPKCQRVLTPYLLRPTDAYCFSPREAVDKLTAEKRSRRETNVQPSQRNRRKRWPRRTPGNRYSRDSYRRAIHRACDKVGVQRWSPNRLRHSAATETRRRFGLEAAQVILGHARADVTQVYAERDMEMAKQIIRNIG